MKELLKRLFWKLPISSDIKERISRARYERVLQKELEYDASASLSVVRDRDALRDYAEYVLNRYGARSDAYREFEKKPKKSHDVKLVAFYLTQFHPNAENDEWWGKGTTEWNNVNQAVPQFVGHYQPRRPGELGYYDLRIRDTFSRQIELAKNYGISAFCFYYYWFDGDRRLLEYPLNLFLSNRSLDIPFFYCWANENWTKRFSGVNSDILMGITPSIENYRSFIDSVLGDFSDNRYYRIDGRPVLSVYRPSLIPDPEMVISYWRERVLEKTGNSIYLIAIQEKDTDMDWSSVGFDAESEFQPKQIQHYCRDITKRVQPVRTDFSGVVYDYADLVKNRRYMLPGNMKKKVYPAVMPMWDNSARRNFRGTIFHGSTPELYAQWLSDVVRSVRQRHNLDEKLVFINAWNEWGEGAYLEPDQEYGYAYLDATYEALK